jgi:hypothetical protein
MPDRTSQTRSRPRRQFRAIELSDLPKAIERESLRSLGLIDREGGLSFLREVIDNCATFCEIFVRFLTNFDRWAGN